MRVVQISDPHLSPTHGFFVANWRKTAHSVHTLSPDLVIVSGDLAINGPDDDKELDFARSEMQRLPTPWRVLPGNHDVGDEPPGQDAKQLIDPPRLARWRQRFGADWWIEEAGEWRVVGLNSQLSGSGLADDAAQRDWLQTVLSRPDPRPIAIFMHKPLFVETPDDGPSSACMTPEPRAQVMARFQRADVRLVASGHLHCYRTDRLGPINIVWAPATSFIIDSDQGVAASGELERWWDRARSELGVIVHDFTDEGWSHQLLSVPGLETRTLAEIKQGRYPFLRDMPPFMPELTA